MTQAEMMERLLLVESETRRSRTEEEKGYSEWRLWHRGGLGSSYSFDQVDVKEDYQNRDFQTSHYGGTVSVIDPEILGKLRREASTLRNRRIRYQLAIYAGLYLGSVLLFLGYCSWGSVSEDFVFVGLIVTQNVWLFLSIVYTCRRRRQTNNVDTDLTSLVESYQPLFQEKYGVELGYDRFRGSLYGGWVTFPAIHLRRPRRSDPHPDEDASHVVGGFAPIYLTPLIPGEISIDETPYDAASMKVEEETWTLLQSTHQDMVQWHPRMMKGLVFVIPCLLAFFLACYWAGGHVPCGGFIPWMAGAVAFIIVKICKHVVDHRNLQIYENVAKVVNEILQKDNENSHLAVEFHATELPGREGNLSRRYQWIQLPMAPPTNELV